MLSIFVLFAFAAVGAQFVVPAYQWYVTDYAGVVSVDQQQALEQKILSIVDTTIAEIAILLVPSIGNDAIAFAATAVGQEWWVGDEDMDTGLLMLVAVEDRERFIAVGYGLEGILPDAIAKRIWERHFPDYFSREDYAWGLSAALDDIGAYISADPAIVADYAQEEVATAGLWLFAVIVSLIFLLVVWLSKDKKPWSKISKTTIWLLFVVVFAFIVASVAMALLLVSFFWLFFLIKSSAGMFMGWMGRWGMSGGFWGWGFGGFGGWWFGGWGAGGRW